MLKLSRVTNKVKLFFLALVYVFNIDLFEFLAAILGKGLLSVGEFRKTEAVNENALCRFVLRLHLEVTS